MFSGFYLTLGSSDSRDGWIIGWGQADVVPRQEEGGREMGVEGVFERRQIG